VESGRLLLRENTKKVGDRAAFGKDEERRSCIRPIGEPPGSILQMAEGEKSGLGKTGGKKGNLGDPEGKGGEKRRKPV